MFNSTTATVKIVTVWCITCIITAGRVHKGGFTDHNVVVTSTRVMVKS